MLPARSAILFACSLAAIGLAQPKAPEPPRLERAARIEDPAPLGVGRLIPDLALAPLKGDATTLTKVLEGKNGVVIAMTSVSCPAAMKYIPRLASIEDEYAAKGVPFIFVNTVDEETEPDMRRVITDQRLEGLYLADRDAAVAKSLGARSTTEVFVIDPSRTLIYRGAIDDQFGVGTTLASPRRHFLKDAIDAMIAKRVPEIRATWAPGCVLDAPKQADASPSTYAGDIARIFLANCVTCHRPGGSAPFALDTYQAVTSRAAMIDAVITDGIMPPWQGVSRKDGEPSPWRHDRSLLPADRVRLLAWLRSSRPMGEQSELPRQMTETTGSWEIGRPDAVFITPAVKLEPTGPIRHARVFLGVPAPLGDEPMQQPNGDRWLHSIEFKPMELKAYHHAVVWIVEPGDPLPAPDAVPTNLQLLGTYAPGDSVLRFESGNARLLKAGSVLVVDQYLQPMNKEMNVALRIGVRVGRPPATSVRSFTIAQQLLSIPAGASGVNFTAERVLGAETTVSALQPMMRGRGRAITVEAILPDATTLELLTSPRFEHRWQVRFEFLEPKILPKGTRLVVRGTFDNSDANASNPDPNSKAVAGLGANDEVLAVVVETVGRPEKPLSESAEK
jgi:mono/diheme cytochrome c family protein